MAEFMKQYFSEIYDSGTLQLNDFSVDYVYGKYTDADDYPPGLNYGFTYYVVFDGKPICHSKATLINVYEKENYNHYLNYMAEKFIETLKDNSSVPF